MKRLFILFLILPFIFTSCKKNEIKTKQNQTTEKTSELKKIKLLELPRDFNEWSKEPISIQKNKDSVSIMIDNITFIQSYESFINTTYYEAETLEQKLKPVNTSISIEISISNNLFNLSIGGYSLKNNYTVSMKDTKNVEKFSKLFLESGLFAVIDELKKYEMYYVKVEKLHLYRDYEDK